MIDALNFRRNSDTGSGGGSYAPGPTAAQGGELAGPETLARALGPLQSDPSALQQQSVRQYLEDNLENISELQGTTGLTQKV